MNFKGKKYNLALMLFFCVLLVSCKNPLAKNHSNNHLSQSSAIDYSQKSLPEVIKVTMAAPDVILLSVEAVWIEHGKQVPYIPAENDEIIRRFQHRFIQRNGEPIGCLVGKNGDLMLTLDKIHGDTLKTNIADLPESYTIKINGHESGVNPKAVYRKSKPVNCTRPPAVFASGMEHYIMLKMNKPLQLGDACTVVFEKGLLLQENIQFNYDPENQFSEAVHVNQLGFRPDDPVKLAFLSFWMGSGGNLSYPDGIVFHLKDQEAGEIVYTGKSTLSKSATDPSGFTFADIHQLDFSDFSRPGIYTVFVEGLGNSFSFEIGENVWRDAFVTSMKGLFFQHSGIELAPPITDFVRPRGFHPKDGFKVYTSEPKTVGEDPSLRQLNPELEALVNSYKASGRFDRWVKDITNKEHPHAWGGYMDAGDWDRRPDHALMPLMMFDLEEMFPSSFAQLRFNVPYDNQNIPDIINEALWEVDFLRRMQQEDGSIYAAIESGEHPRRGECSWQESLPVFAYSRTSGSAYTYVSVGARAAHWFTKNNQPEIAEGYKQSVLKAWNWAEKQPEKPMTEYMRSQTVADTRCLAAAELYQLTGDEKFHNIFLDLTRFKDSIAPFFYSAMGPNGDVQGQAGWTYFRTSREGKHEKVLKNIQNAMVADANRITEYCNSNDFKWARSPKEMIRWGALSMPESQAVCRAHFVTGNKKYLQAIVLSALTGLGANPLNMSYVTGVGSRWPQHPLHEDARNTRQPLYDGVTFGGPIEPRGYYKSEPYPRFVKMLYPALHEWPSTEAFYDVFNIPPMNEYTVHQTMLPTSFVWGYLAARK